MKMKIINNANEYDLPPRFALLNLNSDVLRLYASGKGLAIGIKAAVRNSSAPCGFGSLPFLVVFRLTGCVWDAVSEVDYLGRVHDLSPSDIKPAAMPVLRTLYGLSEMCRDDTRADDTPADDTPADDTPADDTPADDTPAGAVALSYRRKVSCAGNPATAGWCVVFRLGGRWYIRAYQSRGRAAFAFHHYHMCGASSAYLLYYRSPDWALASCVIDGSSCDAVPYTDTHLLVERALALANRCFGKGA